MNNEIDKQDFREIIDGGGIFVDKSLLLRSLLMKHSRSYLVTRPHGFGKSMGLSMIDRFFNLKYAEEEAERDSFEGLKITGCSGYQYHRENVCNRYPVIRINAGEIYDDDPDEFTRMLCEYLVRIAREDFWYLESSEKLDEWHRSWLSETLNGEMDQPAMILDDICLMLELHHGKRPIVLIDDYDAPLSRAYGKPCFEELSMSYGSLIGCVSKWGRHIKFAFMTGVQRVITRHVSDVQNLVDHYPIMSRGFASDFGFTAEDVADAIGRRLDELVPDLSEEEKTGMVAEKLAVAEEWYGGYGIDNNRLFCCRGVMDFLSRNIGSDEPPVAYRDGTSEHGLLPDVISGLGEPGLEQLEYLRRSDYTFFSGDLNPFVAWNLDAFHRFDFARLLIAYGYLAVEVVDHETEYEKERYPMRVLIPNESVRKAYDELEVEVKKKIGEIGNLDPGWTLGPLFSLLPRK